MRKIKFKHLFGLIAIMYPLLVFCVLVVFKLPIRYLSICIIIFAIAYSIVNGRHYRGKHTIVLFMSPVILCTIGVLSFCIDDSLIILLYPALADLAYLTIMVTSFFFPPPLAFYFINIFDKTMKEKIPKERFDLYCIRATVVWCIYFVIDGSIALLTTFPDLHIDIGITLPTANKIVSDLWLIYNAGITYVIMGLIFAGEFIILKKKLKKYSSLNKEGENANS